MKFNANHPVLFVMVGIIIAAVLGQSVYFLIKSYRRAKEKGMDMTVIKKTIKTAAIFTVAPAVSIVITVVALSQSLGVALPWLRLSVVGSLSYETIAAANAAGGMNTTLSELASSMTASQYVTIAIVMTLSIMVGIWLVPVIAKKYQKGLVSFEKKDAKWSEILQNSLFIGMISAFVGFVFCDISRLWMSEGGIFRTTVENADGVEEVVEYTSTSGLVPVFVMLISAVTMCICGVLIKKLSRNDRFDNVFNYILTDSFKFHIRAMLRRHYNRINSCGHAVNVLYCNLSFSVRSEICQSSVLSDISKSFCHFMSERNRKGHKFRSFIASVAKHKSLVAGSRIILVSRLAALRLI